MTTEQQPETKAEEAEKTTKKTTDNKALFGPLGKYAVIAVIMVSIIVTTAIMLDKQLNNAEQEIAVLENEVSDLHTAASEGTTPATTIIVEQDLSVNETVVAKASDAPVLKQATDKTQATTEENVKEEVAATEVVENTAAADTASESKSETAAQTLAETTVTDVKADDKAADKSAATRRTERNKEILARNQANKLKQKQRMSESYARINKRENQQLEQFKTSKDKQIVRLREQGTHEQQFIDALILRNNELVAIREANMQKQQANREQRLNRI